MSELLYANYLQPDVVPQIFKQPEPKKIKEVPMPRIEADPNVPGPLKMDPEEYARKVRKREMKAEKRKKETRADMICLIAKRDVLRSKLGELDETNKKDMRKILRINLELNEINDELRQLEQSSGIHIEELDKGTKCDRFFGRIKRAAKRFKKKVKKFYKRNEELINGLAAIILPVAIMGCFKLIFKV